MGRVTNVALLSGRLCEAHILFGDSAYSYVLGDDMPVICELTRYRAFVALAPDIVEMVADHPPFAAVQAALATLVATRNAEREMLIAMDERVDTEDRVSAAGEVDSLLLNPVIRGSALAYLLGRRLPSNAVDAAIPGSTRAVDELQRVLRLLQPAVRLVEEAFAQCLTVTAPRGADYARAWRWFEQSGRFAQIVLEVMAEAPSDHTLAVTPPYPAPTEDGWYAQAHTLCRSWVVAGDSLAYLCRWVVLNLRVSLVEFPEGTRLLFGALKRKLSTRMFTDSVSPGARLLRRLTRAEDDFLLPRDLLEIVEMSESWAGKSFTHEYLASLWGVLSQRGSDPFVHPWDVLGSDEIDGREKAGAFEASYLITPPILSSPEDGYVRHLLANDNEHALAGILLQVSRDYSERRVASRVRSHHSAHSPGLASQDG